MFNSCRKCNFNYDNDYCTCLCQYLEDINEIDCSGILNDVDILEDDLYEVELEVLEVEDEVNENINNKYDWEEILVMGMLEDGNFQDIGSEKTKQTGKNSGWEIKNKYIEEGLVKGRLVEGRDYYTSYNNGEIMGFIDDISRVKIGR